jgi:DNA topoisomerase-1
MEELGIGRPSTYASIVTTIQDREYVRKDNGALVPEDKGRLVTAFLTNYFRRYVEYDFTAALEDQLDGISAGEADYKEVLARFWRDFSAAIAETSELRIGEVLDRIDEALGPHLYPLREDGADPRLCPTCGQGRLSMRTARTGGAFIGCSRYPDCRYTRPFGPPSEDGEAQAGERLLGEVEGDPIRLKDGRFGPYVQRGEATAENPKPPRASLPKGWAPPDMDSRRPCACSRSPASWASTPEDGQPVEAGIGRYGPFVKHGATYANLPEVAEVFEVGMNRALDVLAQKAAGRAGGRGRSSTEPMRRLGEHPDGGEVAVMPGRFGPYVKWGKVNATIPKELTPEAITLEEAVALVEAKAGTKGGVKGKPRKATAKPKAAATKPKAAATKAKAPAAKAKPRAP